MAEKRMFAKSIIDSDLFLDMPTTAQLLYFHLCMRADDDGFVNNPKRIMRDVRCSDDDMRVLIAKKFIIPFESGIIVIRHWRLHNYVQKDRYKPSLCEEKKLLKANDNKVYEVLDTDCIQNGYALDTECTQNVSEMETQIRLDKSRLDKSSRDKNREVEEDATTTLPAINQEVLNTYQDNIHPIYSKRELEMLADDIERYGNKWVIDAIDRAVLRNKRSLGYIEGILRDWETNGYDDGEKKQEEDPDGFRQPLITEDPQYIEMQRIREELRQIGVDA